MNPCVNCKHLLGKRDRPELAATDWRCHHPSNIASSYEDPVTGVQVQRYVLTNIYSCRSELPSMGALCGVEGKVFEEYVKPSYSHSQETESPLVASPNKVAAFKERLAALKAAKGKAVTLEDI